MEQESMKPCPLCGGEVRIHRRTDGQVDGIVCDECLLTLEAVNILPEWHTLDELVRRWNARAAVTDEQFAMAVHDGEAWQVVRTCRNIGFETGDDFKCSACGEAYNESDDMAMPASRIDWCFSCGAKVVG
ncbi:Lar family restriction alleviation protein [Adlercreutzia equolifaciens]|uniref:Lar family restriction alleviation protein n=1 Tax=Adlercreutzia equolifaciens TaxID=446660 RepID=UPI0026DBC0E6|nr:Lar family restriction alleviation protein [Adlercreutzia equolifaciens]